LIGITISKKDEPDEPLLLPFKEGGHRTNILSLIKNKAVQPSHSLYMGSKKYSLVPQAPAVKGVEVRFIYT
jgi:hypothetical protein